MVAETGQNHRILHKKKSKCKEKGGKPHTAGCKQDMWKLALYHTEGQEEGHSKFQNFKSNKKSET